MVQAPIKKGVTSMTPLIKLPAELLARLTSFPDPFQPRAIRDRGYYFATQFALGDEYKALTGKPSRKYKKSLKGIFVYTKEPYESAYNDIVSSRHRYLESIGEASIGYWLNTKSNALYNFKKAARYNDVKAGAKYFMEYVYAGGTEEGIQESLDRLNPLFGFLPTEHQIIKKRLTAEEQIKILKKGKRLDGFIKYFGDDFKEYMAKALKYYQDTFVEGNEDFYKKVVKEIKIMPEYKELMKKKN